MIEAEYSIPALKHSALEYDFFLFGVIMLVMFIISGFFSNDEQTIKFIAENDRIGWREFWFYWNYFWFL